MSKTLEELWCRGEDEEEEKADYDEEDRNRRRFFVNIANEKLIYSHWLVSYMIKVI